MDVKDFFDMCPNAPVMTVHLSRSQSATEGDFYAHLHAAAVSAGADGGCPVPRNLNGLDELLGCMTDCSRLRLVAPGLVLLPGRRINLVLAVCAAHGVTVTTAAQQ